MKVINRSILMKRLIFLFVMLCSTFVELIAIDCISTQMDYCSTEASYCAILKDGSYSAFCSRCNDNFILEYDYSNTLSCNHSSLSNCGIDCLFCDNGFCIKCRGNRYSNNGRCEDYPIGKCPAYCVSCFNIDGNDTCLYCQEGTALKASNKYPVDNRFSCVTNSYMCARINMNDNRSCDFCHLGFVMNDDRITCKRIPKYGNVGLNFLSNEDDNKQTDSIQPIQ